MQTVNEVGKYVTDGKMVYPYNAHLDELINQGKLHFCDKPIVGATDAPRAKLRSPIMLTKDERLEMAQKLDITLGELTNMSPQEFEEALKSLETKAKPAPAAATDSGFPA